MTRKEARRKKATARLHSSSLQLKDSKSAQQWAFLFSRQKKSAPHIKAVGNH
jgi:hypothetical protein